MMPRAALYSALLHLGVVFVTLIGLPNLFSDEPLVVRAITVELVDIDEVTAAPRISPDPPPKPDPEPEPEEQAALPPPEPPKVETPPPPAPPAPPKVEEAPPPLPEPKKEPDPAPEEKEPEKVVETPPERMPVLKPKLPVKKKQEQKPETDFNKVLQSVVDPETASPTQDKGTEQQVASAQAPAAQQFANRLTISELDAVRAQIERCWNVPIGARDVENMQVEIHVVMRSDATVSSAQIIDRQGRYYGDTHYRAVADSALRAVLNPQCSPLKLPPDKYDTWQRFTLNFNPRDMF